MSRAFASLLLLLALVGSPAAGRSVPPAADAPAASAAMATGNVPEDASSLDLEALRGNVVYLDFWASWCAPCRKSFPWLNEMQRKYGEEGLVIVAVNVDRERKAADAFLKKYAADFRIVYDPKGTLADEYDLQGMPSTFLYGRDGKQTWTHVGFRGSETGRTEQRIRELLSKEKRP